MIDIYKLVILDADNTLFDFSGSEKAALEKLFEKYNHPYEKDKHLKLYKKANMKAWEMFEKKEIEKEKIHTDRWFGLFDNEGSMNLGEVNEVYLDLLSLEYDLIEGAEDTVKYLKDKGYYISIVTNGTTRVQKSRFANSPVMKYVDDIVISEEIGFSKPDVRLFEYAADLSGIKDKSEIIVVGDSLGADIKGGIAFGVDTCYYNILGIDPDEIKPTYIINHISELKNIL